MTDEGIFMLFNGPSHSHPQNGCPACAGEPNTMRFDWRSLQTGPRWITQVEKFIFGSLLQCTRCKQYWYLDGAKDQITLVPPDRVDLLQLWGSRPQGLDPDLFQKAKTIGATPVHSRARQTQYAEVPCRVRTEADGWIDRCLLILTDAAPLDPDFGGARLLSEVLDLEASSYALPLDVRLATSHSQPDDRGQAATYVETEKGKLLSLNWTVNFVDHKKIKGSDLLLSEKADPSSLRKKKLGKIALLQEPVQMVTFFMGHWSKEISELLSRNVD